VRKYELIDRLLIDAAETLIRNRSRRPHWLPAGFPMKLILTMKREALVSCLLEDRALRTKLRDSSRRLVDPNLLSGVTAAEFEYRLAGCTDPHRLVATALIAEDEALVAAAQPWALDPTRLPTSEPPAPPPAPVLADGHDEPPVNTDQQATDPDPDPVLEDTGDRGLDEATTEEVDVPYLKAHPGGADARVESLTAERERLRTQVARLEALILDLRAQIPTKKDRRRQHKQEGERKRATLELEATRVELDALRTERDELVQIRKQLDDQLVEAEEARAVALRKSQHLERQLASAAGRADYLRRSIDKELAEARPASSTLRYGRERTDAAKRVEVLEKLSAALDEAFPEQAEPQVRARRVTVGRTHDFAVTPIGGGTEIGGSAILVEAAGRRILVDAGMHPDGRGPTRIAEVIDGGGIDMLVVTHAHNDHGGYVPALVDRFPGMKVICSDATGQLLPTMWSDSARVMSRAFAEADDATIARPPHYGQAEVETAEARIEERPYHRKLNLGDLGLTLFPAGHILGAAGVVIEGGGRRVVVTGDISGPEDRYLSVEPAHLPEGLIGGADLLAIETTYCHDDHRPRARQEEGLVDAVRSVVERGGRVLIPAFGLGRAQEVVLILTRHLPGLDILVDGLAKDISTIYETISEGAGRSLAILGDRVRPVINRPREIRSFHSGVIVASSGMLTGGASVAWAQDVLPDERAALLLCGYQDEEAPGRKLERLTGGFGTPKLTLPDQDLGWVEVDVRSQVSKYALSAHADRRGLLEIIERCRPKNTMLVHGLPAHQRVFRELLEHKGIRTVPTARWTSCPS
jgi:Cft2 family RNA processing exonuclease